MKLDKLEIEVSYGRQSYGRLGDGIESEIWGKEKKSRLVFKFPKSPETGYANVDAPVYIETIKKGPLGSIKSLLFSLLRGKFVRCRHNDRTIFININSLSKRMGIPKEKIDASSKEGTFQALIESEYERCFAIEEKADRIFQSLMTSQYPGASLFGELRMETGETLHTTRSELRKILGIAAFSPVASEEGPNEATYQLKQSSASPHENDKYKLLQLKRKEAGEFPHITLFTRKMLGEGHFAEVELVEVLSEGEIVAVKMLKDPRKSQYRSDVNNENSILNQIFQTNPQARGIQKAPLSLFDFSPPFQGKKGVNKTEYYGFLAPKYEFNLHSLLKMEADPYGQVKTLTKHQWIEGVRQLLEGLVELERQQICHGDIKLENCLIKRNQNGTVEFALSDFGGAVDFKESVKEPRHSTAEYLNGSDSSENQRLELLLSAPLSVQEKGKFEVKFKSNLYKRDVYAMGLLLDALMRSMCRAHFRIGFALSPISQMIQGMSDIELKKRWTATEALNHYNGHYPPISA